MTKADRIKALYDGTRTTREIAEIVGCLPSYVRVVCRQRINGMSRCDRAYRDRINALGDLPSARKARASVYRKARAEGASISEAERQGVSAYLKVLRKTAGAIPKMKEPA